MYRAERGGQLLGEALGEPVDVHQLAAPGVGVDAEAVALAVHLAVVRVDQRPVPGGELRRGEVHPLLAGEPAVEGAAAERDLGERGVLEGRGGHLGGMDTRGVGELEDGGVRLPHVGRGPGLPAELVHQGAGRGVTHGVADEAVRARRQPRTYGGEGGGGGGGETRGDRAAGAAAGAAEQRGQEGRLVGVGRELLPAESVDQEDTVPVGGGELGNGRGQYRGRPGRRRAWAAGRRANRCRTRGRGPWTGRAGRGRVARRGLRGHQRPDAAIAAVASERDWAKASVWRTASGPSPASLTRRLRSSAVELPV